MQFSALFIAAAAGLVSAAGNITHGAANATVTEVGVVTANKTVQVTVTSCKDDACHKATSTPAAIVPVPVQNGTVSNHTTGAANHTHGAKPSPSQAEGTHTGTVPLANGAQALGFSAVVAGVAAAALLI